eukprot:g6291.t1
MSFVSRIFTSWRPLYQLRQQCILSLRSIGTDTNEAKQEDISHEDEDEANSILSNFFTDIPQTEQKTKNQTESPTPPTKDTAPQLRDPPKMPRIPRETTIQRIMREHNSTLFNLKGQVIIGEVKAVGKREVIVDLGWKNYQTFFKKEINLSQLYTQSGTDQKKRDLNEIQPGDELHFRIEELDTPYGELFVSTQRMRADIRRQLVWEELKRAFHEGRLVTGRTLNPCNAGYAIGIAGFVAFCPLARISSTVERKIGVLQPFVIVKISDTVAEDLIVSDATVRTLGGVMKGFAVVTGANRGLGYALCLQLAREGTPVLMASRTKRAGDEAAAKLKTITNPEAPVVTHELDMSRSESIDQFVETIRRDYNGQINLLINNAGVMKKEWNKESFEFCLTTNLHGPMELTEKLVPYLAHGSRVVMVSSGLANSVPSSSFYGKLAKAGFESIDKIKKIEFRPDYPATDYSAYSVSKVLLNAGTRFFSTSAEFKDKKITIDSVCPGWCRTDMGSQAANRSAEEGARTILEVAKKNPPTTGLFYTSDGEPKAV